MQIDIVIGNPPYQELDGEGISDSAKPTYDKFIKLAKVYTKQYISFVIPSRWMVGGKGLDSFREEMLNDAHIQYIIDYANANEIFKGVHIDSGICYFLYNKNYSGDTDYTYISYNGDIINQKRKLRNTLTDTVIRDYRQYSIIEHIVNDTIETFDTIVTGRNPYGISTDLFNRQEYYKWSELNTNEFENSVKIYGVEGNKGGAKRVFGYINRNRVSKNEQHIDKYKILFSYAYSTYSTTPPSQILAKPGEVCTETFLSIGPFDTEEEQVNCYKYMQTKFFRALLFFNRAQKNATDKTFKLIPLENFSHAWTDKELYSKYGLTQEEIEYIEKIIEPLE